MECGILVPEPGIEPTSPALVGRFLTTGPPGKPSLFQSWSWQIRIWLFYQAHQWALHFFKPLDHTWNSKASGHVRSTNVLLKLSVQSLSRVWLFSTPWTAPYQAFLSITNSRSLPKLMSIESVMPSSHLILCCPLLLLPSIPPSVRVFSNESVLHIGWPKYWSFSFNFSPSNEDSGLISFRMDWLELLAIQGTLKSLLQHHSSKASIL